MAIFSAFVNLLTPAELRERIGDPITDENFAGHVADAELTAIRDEEFGRLDAEAAAAGRAFLMGGNHPLKGTPQTVTLTAEAGLLRGAFPATYFPWPLRVVDSDGFALGYDP